MGSHVGAVCPDTYTDIGAVNMRTAALTYLHVWVHRAGIWILGFRLPCSLVGISLACRLRTIHAGNPERVRASEAKLCQLARAGPCLSEHAIARS